MKKRMRPIGILLFWLLLWQWAAGMIDNNILFVGPADVLAALFEQSLEWDFWKTIGFSFSRISLGFLSAFFTAIFLGSLSYRFSLLKELLNPVMLLAKSVPVASFVILALIWMGSKNLAAFCAFIVVLPIIYVCVLSGLESTQNKLLEMASIFQIPLMKKIKAVYWPALIPYLISGVNSALGMAIKSSVAAEVIGVPEFSIGEKLYKAKIYLSTADLFAWTLVVIFVSWLFEKAFLRLLESLNPAGAGRKSGAKNKKISECAAQNGALNRFYTSQKELLLSALPYFCRDANRNRGCMRLELCHINKSFGSLDVLKEMSAEFTTSDIYCLTAPSGAGKTTLFRLIMGLEKPDSGTVSFFDESVHTPAGPLSRSADSIRFSSVFQEDRLIEHLSPMENTALVLSGKTGQADIRGELSCLLPEESLDRPVSTLSGGMRRRCAFMRAMMAASDIVIMDEPFTGLDYDTKNLVIEYLLAHRKNRMFLIATHDPSDIKKLDAVTLKV